jgi:carbamoyl-phosphate synthase small subunit
MSKECFLILEDGTEFTGKSFGYEGDTMGEVVFNTSMSAIRRSSRTRRIMGR